MISSATAAPRNGDIVTPLWVTAILPRLARNTIIESTFEVGLRFRCTMRVDCGQLAAGAVIRPEPAEWHRVCPRPR
jgi:hypothetical protein